MMFVLGVLGRPAAAAASAARAAATASGRGQAGFMALSPTGSTYASAPPIRARAYRSTTALWDTRRRRNPHFETNVSKTAGGPGAEQEEDGEGALGWKAWEFGEALPQKKRRRLRAEGDEAAGEEEEGEEDLKEETHVSDVAAATACLAKFATPARLQRLREIVERRTAHVAFVFENPSNPNNMWACLRSLDAFGVQNVHLVVDPEHYRKAHRLVQAKSAMGGFSLACFVCFAGGGWATWLSRPLRWVAESHHPIPPTTPLPQQARKSG